MTMPLCEKFFLDSFLKEPYKIALFLQKGSFLHTGLLVNDNGIAKQIHLAWHHKLCCETPPDNNLYVTDFSFLDRLTSTSRQILVQYIVSISATYQNSIPYATKYRDTLFTQNGELIFGKHEHGLTCATFVLAVFSQFIKIIDVETWQMRPDDDAWRDAIIAIMEKHRIPQEHIDKVVNEKGNIRVRPEEVFVASAKAMPDAPCEFVFCASEGQKVKKLLSAIF
jgi:hypothetical protein